MIGGQYFAWNEGFSAGFGSEIISVIFIGLGYIALCLCNAELTSSLPFAGGAYGLARLTLGLFPGFLIGCCETVEYIIYVASSTISLSRMISDLAGTTDEIIPIYCLIFYFIASGILIAGGQFFWRISSFFGALSLIILLMYCLGSLPYTDFRVYAVAPSTTGINYLAADYDTGADSNPMYFIGGMQGFMKILPLASWFYVGVESLNFSAGVVSNPKTNIPIGSICCVLTLFFCAIFVVFVTAALPSNSRTGVPTAFEPTPFSTGFALMFRIPDEIAIIFSLPATFATAYGFVFAYSRIMIAMARSALLPPLLMRTYGKYHTPYVSIIVGSLISYGLCLLVYFRPTTGQYLFPTCILSAFCAYVCQFVGYIIFKVKYDQHKRLFTSPWGISGAVFGAIVFFIGAVAVCIFQEDEYYNLMIMSVLICTYTLAYFGYSKKKQNFSAEEKIFWPVHILKCKKQTDPMDHIFHFRIILFIY